MTTISILLEKNDSYRAFARDKEAGGRTLGEALDALTSQLANEESGTLVIVQNRKADEFFNHRQQTRLAELMQRRRAGNLSTEEAEELERLVEAELDAARCRAAALEVHNLDVKNGIKIDEVVRAFETNIIRQALILTGGNQARAARLLGIKQKTLNYKIKLYNLP